MAFSSARINRWQDFILIGLAVIGGILFFGRYPDLHPYSAADASLSGEQVEQKAREVLQSLGYSTTDLEAEQHFKVRAALIDSLQRQLGSRRMVARLHDKAADSLSTFYWTVVLKRKVSSGGAKSLTAETTGNENGVRVERSDADWREIAVLLDQRGRWIGLQNSDEMLPSRLVQRQALEAVFKPSDGDSTLFASHSDSLLSRLLYFDFQGDQSPPEVDDLADHTDRLLNQDRPYRYNRRDAVNLAQYYLNRSQWKKLPLQVDTVFIERVGSVNVARVHFNGNGAPKARQPVSMRIDVAPTGALLGMNVDIGRRQSHSGEDTWNIVSSSLMLVIALLLLVVFFRRLRARVIDTRSALVVSIFAGLLMPVQYLMLLMGQMEMADLSTIEFLLIYVTMIGSTGAVSMLIFFVLSGVGESLTRHAWPGKLGTYDLIRSGMILNRPVGYGVLRAMALGLVLAGLWTLMLELVPRLSVRIGGNGISNIFYADRVVWPPLFVLSKWTFESLILMMTATLALGSLVYDWKGKYAAVAVIVIAVAVLPFYPDRLHPAAGQIFAMGIVGLVLAVVYLRWDFFTVWLSYFFFGLLLRSDTGWLPAGSGDWPVALAAGALFLVGVGVALWSITRGKTEKALPRYVPDYVEELAQEERMKQELEIAHRVQQSFLPVETPDFPGLDMAAICKPAFETGGDYYDMIRLDENRVAVTIGDVSGKGIQAAFYMTFTKGILHSLCREVESPARLLSKANRLFYDNAPRGTFISLIYGILDLKEHTFRFARAGHNPVLYRNARTGDVKFLQPNGLGLGMTILKPFEDHISEVSLPLEDGDLLVLYTDGIVEAQNDERSMYGMERLKALMERNSHLTSKDILDELAGDVEQFIENARQHDDMTVIIIRRTKDGIEQRKMEK